MPEKYDIVTIGAGPVGLMLSACMAHLGPYKIKHIGNRPEPTSIGRADGIMARTMDVLENMALDPSIQAFNPGLFTRWLSGAPRPMVARRSGERVPLLLIRTILTHGARIRLLCIRVVLRGSYLRICGSGGLRSNDRGLSGRVDMMVKMLYILFMWNLRGPTVRRERPSVQSMWSARMGRRVRSGSC